MPPDPLEASRVRGVGPPAPRSLRLRTRSPHSMDPRPLAPPAQVQVRLYEDARQGPVPEGSDGEPASHVQASPSRGGSARLEALLSDLGAQLRRGAEPRLEPAGIHPTGLPALDALLPGGFPAGRISELCGPLSSGRTAIALALLAETTERRGGLAALVDPADAFDPPSANAAGVDLERLLWIRPGSPLEALRCTERLMETGGLPLVLLDLAPASPVPLPTRRPPGSRSPAHRQPALHHWIRLARLAETTGTALLVLSRERLTGSQAAFALETRCFRPEFKGPMDGPHPLETHVALVRARGTPIDRSVCLPLETGLGVGSESGLEGRLESHSPSDPPPCRGTLPDPAALPTLPPTLPPPLPPRAAAPLRPTPASPACSSPTSPCAPRCAHTPRSRMPRS